MNSAARKLLLTTALAVIAGAVYLLVELRQVRSPNLDGGDESRTTQEMGTEQRDVSEGEDKVGKVGTDPSSQIPGQPSPQPKMKLVFPSVEDVRKQVQEAPHDGVPEIVREFVERLANRMEEALGGTDPTQAIALFAELEGCATHTGPERPSVNIQVQCAWSARRLSEERQDAPTLLSAWKSLEGKLPPSVALLLSQMDRLQEKADREP